MKRILLALAVAFTTLLTGCGFDSDECIRQVAAVNKATFDATAKQAEAMLLALKGDDAQAKGMALMWFAQQDRRMQAMGYGECNRNSALEWARVLVPGVTNLWGVVEANRTARHASDNAVRTQELTFGTIETIATKGLDEAGKVTIPPVYTVPMGSAPAAPAEAAPVDPAANVGN